MIRSVVFGPVRAATRTAGAVGTATAAVGSATLHGVVGGMAGTVAGVREGWADSRTRSAPAALTVVAIGTLGLVEWPLMLAIGGTVLAARRLARLPARRLARLPARLRAQPSAAAPVTAIPPTNTAGKPRKSSTRAAQSGAGRRKPH
ncbi:MAG: hypothetical protein JOZ49_16570 [Mycolicibacterium sp.]|nr:hypothetical protein [Mycolicibacterium sp.]